MSFLDELQKNTNKTETANGAVTNRSTLDPVLDLFSMAGAMRENSHDAAKLFAKAYAEDNQMAVRCMFYLRDIRGGQGERDVFYACFRYLMKIDPKTAKLVMHHVPEYGRWDELVDLFPAEALTEIVTAQFKQDEADMKAGNSISLMAKWLPSENTSSSKTAAQAKALAKALDLKPAQYRKKVVALRKYIKLLEQKMSANEWGE